MFLYKFGYGSYEDSRFSEVLHEIEYSGAEFKEIVFNAIIRVFRGIIDGKYDVYVHDDGVSYEEIHDYVLEEMLAVGFKEVKYKSEWYCFGWPGITDETSWESQRGDDLRELTAAIPQDIKDSIKVLIEKHKIEEEKEMAEWKAKKKEEANV
jgi:hypothetical protein